MTQLRIDGAVLSPQAFRFEDLRRLPGQVADVGQCIPGRDGSGIRLQSLLEQVGPQESVKYITLESTDGTFSASVPLAAVQDAIVAYKLEDAPLPAQKGGPFRFFIPDVAECAVGEVDACANVKFLGRMHLSREPGRDVRPTSAQLHQEHHEKPGHEHVS